MNHNFYKDRYKATQLSVENIKIVEIRELYQLFKIRENSETSGSIKIRDCIEPLGDLIEQDYLDYVVFYHDESCNAQKLKSLIEEYKKEAVCVIGCCSNQTENSSLTAKEKNLFDLYCSHPCSENDLENLIELLLSVRTGFTHGFPENIKELRIDETNNLFSIKYATFSDINEIAQKYTKLISEKNFDSEPVKFKNYFLSIFCKKDDSNLINIDKFLRNRKFEDDELLMYTVIEDDSFDNQKIVVLCS